MGVRWQIDYNEIFDEIDDVLDEALVWLVWLDGCGLFHVFS